MGKIQANLKSKTVKSIAALINKSPTHYIDKIIEIYLDEMEKQNYGQKIKVENENEDQ